MLSPPAPFPRERLCLSAWLRQILGQIVNPVNDPPGRGGQMPKPEMSLCTCPACRDGLTPFTREHFDVWARDLTLDNGKHWRPEKYELDFAEDLFEFSHDEIPAECWLVVPEGNGKTTFFAGLALYYLEHYWLIVPSGGEPGVYPAASIPVAASSRDQAKRVYQQAEVFVVNSPRLHASAPNVFEQAKGKPLRDVPRCRCERANRKRERARRPPRLRAPQRRRQVRARAPQESSGRPPEPKSSSRPWSPTSRCPGRA
jgi:hypothetical protein